jgi:hypothetical protein
VDITTYTVTAVSPRLDFEELCIGVGKSTPNFWLWEGEERKERLLKLSKRCRWKVWIHLQRPQFPQTLVEAFRKGIPRCAAREERTWQQIHGVFRIGQAGFWAQ